MEKAKPKRLSADLQQLINKLLEKIKAEKYFRRKCKVCDKGFEEQHFPRGKNPFFMDGRINVCRNCISGLIDPHNPVEVQYILSLMFLPYVEEVWEKILKEDDKPLTTYIAKMNLTQYRNLEPAVVHRLKSQLERFQEDPYQARVDLMTEDELKFLKAEWGESWNLVDCLKMQDYYKKMQQDFNIANQAHHDYVKKIIKTSLKVDKLLEDGELKDYKDLTKVYNDLMKAAEFSAASKKDKKSDDGVNAVGLIYSLAEKKKFIPKYHNEEDPDVVDKTEKNLKSWMHKLVSNEADLVALLENAARRVVEQEKQEEQMTEEYADIAELEDGL